MQTSVDCTGRSIRIGMIVQHRLAPKPSGDSHHAFAGTAKVTEILPSGNVIVEKKNQHQIPVYCNRNVMVVADEDGRPVEHPEQQ
jgi:hypothetical protein